MLHGAHYVPKQMSASANVKSTQGVLAGIFCSSSTSGTVAIYDDSSTGTTTKLVDTFTVAAGTYYPLPLAFQAGLNVVIANTAQITVFYR